jgi:hypothetical protein
MIKMNKKDGFFDEQIGDVLVRHFADTTVRGWLSAINHTPANADYSEILNIDIVVSDRPQTFGKWNFEYPDGYRLAIPSWWTRTKFRHVHLMVDQQQISQLKKLMYKKIDIVGDEIALTKAAGGSFFLVDARVPGWLGLPPVHELVDEIRAGCNRNKKLNRTSCHSIKPQKIERAGFFN